MLKSVKWACYEQCAFNWIRHCYGVLLNVAFFQLKIDYTAEFFRIWHVEHPLFGTVFTPSSLTRVAPALVVAPVLSPATAHIYLTLLTHTPAYSRCPSNFLALSITMWSQCPIPPQTLNTRPKSLALGIAARIASEDWRELGARIITLLWS